MKIVHLIFNLRIGGMETMLIDIINRQVATGHDVTLLIINEGQDSKLIDAVSPGAQIKILGRKEGSKNPLWFWKINRAIRRLSPDVVHAHNVMALGYLPSRHPYALFFTHHSTGIGKPGYLKRTDAQAAISDAVALDVRQRLGFDTRIVINGISTAGIVARDRRPLNPDCIRIIQIGRLRHLVKGQDLTLQAAALLKDRYNLHIDFFGDGPSRDFLVGEAERLGLAGKAVFHGSADRQTLYASMHTYDICLLTSRQEGFGLTLAEGMAAALPVITSDLPGPLEVIDGGRLGEVFPSGDAEKLAESIARVIDNYPRYTELAQGPARGFAATFSVDNTADTYVGLYRSLINNSKNKKNRK